MRRRDASTTSVERGGTAKAATAASPAMLDMRHWGVEAIFVMINDQCWMRFFHDFSDISPNYAH